MRRALTGWAILRRARSLAGILRALGIILGTRRITPEPGALTPWATSWVEDPDTGGGYRPAHRPQDPGVDPREPGGGESGSRGTDHGWSNCTMASGADALAYHTGGAWAGWGGDLRHRQADLEGGTDLADLRQAWADLGHTLTIRSGAGWSALAADHNAGKAIVVQGTGEVPGSGSFDGGHACCIGVETHSDGRWLWGDPLASGWQWIEPGAIRSWAERWQSSCAWAVSKDVTASPPPPDPDCPDCPPQDYTAAEVADMSSYAAERAVVGFQDALVADWAAWLRGGTPTLADAWSVGAWSDPITRQPSLGYVLRLDPCAEAGPAYWARTAEPFPIYQAAEVVSNRAAWDAQGWREAAWP